VFSDDAEDSRTPTVPLVDRAHQIDRDVFLDAATADGEDQQRIAFADPRSLQPFGKRAVPTVVVHAGGELGDVVGRCVRLESADFAEIVDGMTGVSRRAADT